MRLKKKIICILMSVLMLLPLAACSDNSVTVAKYKDTSIDSSMFSYMLSSQKAYLEQMLYYYYKTTDFDSVWASEFSKDESGNTITFGDNAFNGIVDALKMFVVVKQLCKEYGLNVTDESTVNAIEGYISEDIETAGDINFLEIALAEYGAKIGDEKDYLYTTSLTSVLLDYLYGDNGTMKIPDSDIRADFDKNYTKVDMNMFSYSTKNDSGTYVSRVDSDIPESEMKDYFNRQYVKAEHILFYFYDTSDKSGKTKISEADMQSKREAAAVLFEKIKNGEITFDDAKKENNEDTGMFTDADGDVIEKGKLNEKFADFEKMLFDLEIGGIAMIETDVGVHIVRRNAMADKDFDDAKDDISKAVTKERIANEAKDFFEKVKNGSAKLNDETKYGSYQEAVVYSAGEMGEEVEKLIAELKDGESLIYNDDSCTVIIRRLATTDDDYKKEYSTIKSALSQEAFYAYLESLYPQVELNEEEIAKYTFAAVKSLSIKSYNS